MPDPIAAERTLEGGGSFPGSSLDPHRPGEQALRTLLHLYRGERRRLVLALGFFVIKHSPVWIGPLITAQVIDIVADPEHHRLAELGTQGLWLALLLLQNLPTHYLYIRQISGATRGIEMRLRLLLCEKLQRLSLLGSHGASQRHGTGALQSKLLRDVEVVGQLTMNLFQNVPATIITLLVALGVTAVRAPVFLGFFLLLVPLAGLLGRQLRRTLEERNRDFRREVEGLSAHLVEMIRLLPVTRAHGAEAAELGRLGRVLHSTHGAGLQLDRLNALFGSAAWVSFHLAHALCLLTAGWLAYRHRWSITVGDVVLLAGYFGSLTSGVLELANAIPQISKGFESIRSIGEVLDSTDVEDNDGKRTLAEVRGHLDFEAVRYVYPEGAGPGTRALDEVSLTVRPGETLAVVGPSGAGKSTLLNLLIGFLRPTAGRILLDGQDLADLDLRSYRRFLSVVPQDTLIFDGTVADNVLHGAGEVPPERLRQALADANALEFVERLPGGVNTRVGEGGARLSGGQRQRLAIARALIRDPRILILDEATAALDSESEALVQEALARLMHGRTTVVVAHRLSTIRHATRIAVLSEGRLVEYGTPAELLGQRGLYARLHALAQLPNS